MTAKPYHHGDLRNALLRAAREGLRAGPPEALSLRHLARDIGVSANAPYRHFADRDALLAAVAAEGYRALTETIRTATADEHAPSPLAALAETYLGFARAEPGLFRLMFTPGASQSGERDEAAQELFAEILATVDRDTGGDPEQSLRGAVGVWVTLQGSTMFALDGTLDWLDSWLRPGAAEIATATVTGLAAPTRRRRAF